MNRRKPAYSQTFFTRKDRIAVLAISILIIFIYFLPEIFQRSSIYTTAEDTSWFSAVRELQLESDSTSDDFDRPVTYSNYHPRRSAPGSHELFYFDPNTTSVSDWRLLGLSDKTITTIQNFLSKGGHFYKPDDLGKIYGLRKELLERLRPYVRIEFVEKINDPKPVKSDRSKTISTIDINLADTSDFIALPGIGNKLAGRIVNFREKLGGFYSIDQVAETFGLPDSVFQKIKSKLQLTTTTIRLIDLNTATFEELKSHPYIRSALGKAIISYRTEHGPFTNMEDLKKIMAVTEIDYDRITHYITLDR